MADVMKLKPGTACSCGQPMVKHPANADTLVCPHCDSGCELKECGRCRMFNLGSGHKKALTWSPMVLYVKRPSGVA